MIDTLVKARSTTSTAAPPVTTKAILLGAVAVIRSKFPPGHNMRSVDFVESMPSEQVKAVLTKGTAVQAIVDSAAALDAPIQGTGAGGATTFGDVMKATGLDERDMHALGCHCAGDISADRAARELQNLADRH